MMSHRLRKVPVVVLAALAAFATTGWLLAEAPKPPAASAYAPAQDVVSQIDYYLIDRTGKSLADKDKYSASLQKRVKKDANTLAVLLLAAGMHDEDNKYRAAAPAMLPLAQKLADASEDFDKSAAILTELQAAAGQASSGGQPLQWEKVASLEQLMKQVPTINNSLKRALKQSRFEKSIEKSAGYSATLAVIAQAAMADTHEAKTPEDVEKWYKFTTVMRDAAGDINSAVRAKDFERATAAMEILKTNCDDCHAVFRKEEKH